MPVHGVVTGRRRKFNVPFLIFFTLLYTLLLVCSVLLFVNTWRMEVNYNAPIRNYTFPPRVEDCQKENYFWIYDEHGAYKIYFYCTVPLFANSFWTELTGEQVSILGNL